jgi:hypothetical protein
VLTNQKYTQALPLIWKQLHHEVSSVRVTAIWSIVELSLCLYQYRSLSSAEIIELRARLIHILSNDIEDEVCAELSWAIDRLSEEVR